ncbi:lipoprotein [Mycoplasma capricolum subsp. capricolum]|uniref:lipoprotein n=1 Tax=Mycoplasma capricolum TaxID=2095 RepID=UPI003DA6C44F
MKKLLTLLGSVTLIATTSAAVIACGGTRSEQKVAEDKKDDEKREKVLTQSTKNQISSLLKTTLSNSLESLSEETEIDEEITKDFANLLDEILMENNSDIDKSLKIFEEEFNEYITNQLVGSLNSNSINENFEKKEVLDEIVFADEDNFIGIIFNKDPENDIKPIQKDEEKVHKVVKELMEDYKQTVDTIKKELKEDTEETFNKLKDLLTKDLSSATLK